jgi:hypothetical protein
LGHYQAEWHTNLEVANKKKKGKEEESFAQINIRRL